MSKSATRSLSHWAEAAQNATLMIMVAVLPLGALSFLAHAF